jgi:hypothetical protein
MRFEKNPVSAILNTFFNAGFTFLPESPFAGFFTGLSRFLAIIYKKPSEIFKYWVLAKKSCGAYKTNENCTRAINITTIKMAENYNTSEHCIRAYALYVLARDHPEDFEQLEITPIEDKLPTLYDFLAIPTNKTATASAPSNSLDDLFADVQAEMETPKEKTIMYLDDIQTASEEKMLAYLGKTAVADPQAVKERVRQYRADPQLTNDYGLDRQDRKDVKLIRAMYVAVLETSGDVEIRREYRKENSGVLSLAKERQARTSLLPDVTKKIDAS